MHRTLTWPFLFVAGLALTIISRSTLATTLTTGKDEQSRLPYWQIEDRGIMLRLVQRLPDQSRGFFMARKFSPAQAEIIATSCVFQTIFKNTSHETTPSPLHYDLRDWDVIIDGKHRKLRTREDWEREWKARSVGLAAMSDFYWALIPTAMTYEPGDYNWGMSFYNLKPGTTFDLNIVWQQYDQEHEYRVRNIQCSPDLHPDPSEFGRSSFE